MKKIILLITCLGLSFPSTVQAAPKEEVSYTQLAEQSMNEMREIEREIKKKPFLS